MSDPLVSVIIPTYKRPNKLKRAINSVFNQTYKNWELIIVDDNNEGDEYRKETVEFMKSYLNESKIYYIKHKQNKGGSTARNTGIKNAKGKYVSFLDDDDFFLPEKIELQINKALNDNLDIVYCGVEDVDEEGNFLKKRSKFVKQDFFKYQIIYGLTVTSSLFIRKELLLEVDGFRDLISNQEADLLLRLLVKEKRIGYIKQILVKREVHTNARISNSGNKIKKIKNSFNIRKQYFNYLNKKEKNLVKQLYYLKLYREYIKYKNYKEAFKNYYFAIKSNFFDLRNLLECIYIILGYNKTNKLKQFLHKKLFN
ncbi:MAG: glycosyltransferase family 2 protein [archaeon]